MQYRTYRSICFQKGTLDRMTLLVHPTKIKFNDTYVFEVSCHKVSTKRSFVAEIRHIFPFLEVCRLTSPVSLPLSNEHTNNTFKQDENKVNNLIVIPVMQKAKYELVNFHEDVDRNKDLLLENVSSFSSIILLYSFYLI